MVPPPPPPPTPKSHLMSVLDQRFLLCPQMEFRVQKAFPELELEEIPQLTACLIQFLELKVIMEEYSSDFKDHLLAATPLLEQAWLSLYGDCELYPQVIMSIQQFHGQPKSHVFLRRTSSLMEDQDYLAKLARTQSLMQCYYQATMPNTLRELSLQASRVSTTTVSTSTVSTTLKKAHKTVHFEPAIVEEQQQQDDILLLDTEYDCRPNDLPSVVVPENDSEDDSEAYSSTYASHSLTETDYTGTDYTDTITQTSTLTNSTGVLSRTVPDNVCVLMSMIWKRNCCGSTTSKMQAQDRSYQYADYAKEPAQPVNVKQSSFPDDITISVSSSEGSPTVTPRRGKKPYQKLNKRIQDFKTGWDDLRSYFWCHM